MVIVVLCLGHEVCLLMQQRVNESLMSYRDVESKIKKIFKISECFDLFALTFAGRHVNQWHSRDSTRTLGCSWEVNIH